MSTASIDVTPSGDVRPRVGVLGCGRMGGSAALNLADHGYEVAVFDLDAGKRQALEAGGCRWTSTIAELAAECEVVLVSLPGPADVDVAVTGPNGLLQAWDGTASRRTVIDVSTIGPAAASPIAAACESAGVGFVDAPIAGNPDQTRDGSMRLLVGGSDADVESAAGVLHDLSSGYEHFGAAGSGQAAKLALNSIQGVFLAGVSESIAHLMRLDIAVDKFVDIAAGMDYQAWVRRTLNALVSDEYDFGFTVDLLVKDLRLATEARESVDAHREMSQAAWHTFSLAQEAERGGMNLAVLTPVLAQEVPHD